MFHQVLVREDDRDALRFLWFPDNDIDRPPVEYRMNEHPFRCKSSPSVAAFVLRKVAEDNLTLAEDSVIETVRKNFYVDDMCKSCASVDESVHLIKQLCLLLRSGGFHLTKFIASNQIVLDSVPPEDLASCVVDADNRELPTQKTLGVYWNAQLDNLEVKVSIRGKPCTRRGLLSMIGQTYDPLGLLQPFLLPARMVLKQACRAGLTWDELVSSTGVGIKEWDKWIEALPCLESVSIPRSFKLLGRKVEQIDLHVFVTHLLWDTAVVHICV